MCRRLITEFVGFCLHFYLYQNCAFETILPVATIFCPVVHITGQLRGEQSDISETEENVKSTAGVTYYPGHSSLLFCPWDPAGAGLKHNPCDTYNWIVDPQD